MTTAELNIVLEEIRKIPKPDPRCMNLFDTKMAGAFKEINDLKKEKADKDVMYKITMLLMSLIGIVYSASIGIMWYLLNMKDSVQ